YQFAAVLQSPQFLQSQERSAGEISLHAKNAVELDRVPDGFVNLQPELRAFEDNVESSLRTLVCLVQGYRFLADAPRILYQLQLINQLIALVLPLSAKRIRIRTLLDLAPRKRVGDISGPGRKLRLMNFRAFG